MTHQRFTKEELPKLCKKLAKQHTVFATILKRNGLPPFWSRPNSFATLIHIILEQQVSLASAKAAFDKLKLRLGKITPEALLTLSDAELKACYFSRQKTVYARCLAQAIVNKQLNLTQLAKQSPQAIHYQLIQIKGIGVWTIEVYLLMVLHYTHIFPLGDIALVNSMKHELQLHPHTTKAKLEQIVASWQPLGSVAAFLLWWAYIQRKGLKF